MATLLYADGRKEDVTPKNGSDFTLEELQGFVVGYIDIVSARNNRILVVDDEGLYKEASLNLNATNAAGMIIVGDALLCEKWEVK